jgi:hypothetical protein
LKSTPETINVIFLSSNEIKKKGLSGELRRTGMTSVPVYLNLILLHSGVRDEGIRTFRLPARISN